MQQSLEKLLSGYEHFKQLYTSGKTPIMQQLADHGQKPEYMIVSCCDSRVDPALIFQMHPGDLFITRNVANIVPPFECDDKHHGTSAALEFGICYLHVKHLIIMAHSQCGGIQARLNNESLHQNDFISNWVSLIDVDKNVTEPDEAARQALLQSYQNCLTFPWIKKRLDEKTLSIHLWFFDIETAGIVTYDFEQNQFHHLL